MTDPEVEQFYEEREEQYRELNARAHVGVSKFIVDCPGCGSPMVLGKGWMGCSIPECPDCNDTDDEWIVDPRVSEARAEELSTGDADVTELVRS